MPDSVKDRVGSDGGRSSGVMRMVILQAERFRPSGRWKASNEDGGGGTKRLEELGESPE